MRILCAVHSTINKAAFQPTCTAQAEGLRAVWAVNWKDGSSTINMPLKGQ